MFLWFVAFPFSTFFLRCVSFCVFPTAYAVSTFAYAFFIKCTFFSNTCTPAVLSLALDFHFTYRAALFNELAIELCILRTS